MTEHAATTDLADADARALVIYASTHGHTARIATRVAQAMRSQGLGLDLREVSTAADADPAGYDVVVVGASIHRVHHQPEIVG